MQSDELQSISPRYRGRPTNIHCDIDQKRVYRKINGKKQPTCVEQTEVRKKCPTGKIKHKGKCIKKEDKPTGTRGRPRTCDEGKKRVYRKVDGVKTRTCVKPTEVRKKCPTGKINHKGKCIKKGDNPTGTRGRPKKQPLLTKDTIQKKTQLVAQEAQAVAQKKRKKQAQAAAQKKRKEEAQQKRLKLNAKEYNKVVKEIKEFYRRKFDLYNKIYYSLHNYDKFLINDDDIKNMPAFMKFSGITKEEAEKIIEESRKLYKKLEFNACDANAFILDNILLGKINVNERKFLIYDSFVETEKLPIEVLLGTAITNFRGWEWTEVGPFNYWGMEVYEKIINPKFLEEDLYAIKSFNKKRYNKFLDLMKKKGVEF